MFHLDVEQDLVPARGEDHLDRVIRVAQDPHQLRQGPGGHHDARVADRVEDRDRLHRDPVVVGGGQGHRVALEAAQDAGQDRSRLVGRGREGRLLEGPLQDVLGDAGGRALAGRLDGRELVGVDPLDVGLERTGAHVERLVRAGLEFDPLAAGQRAHEIRQEARRHRGGAVRLDLAGNPVHEADLEVRGRQPQSAILRSQEDVREHGQGAPVGDGPAHDPEAARQVLLHHRELHVRALQRAGRVGRSKAKWLRRAGLPGPAKPRRSVCVSSSIYEGPSSP